MTIYSDHAIPSNHLNLYVQLKNWSSNNIQVNFKWELKCLCIIIPRNKNVSSNINHHVTKERKNWFSLLVLISFIFLFFLSWCSASTISNVLNMRRVIVKILASQAVGLIFYKHKFFLFFLLSFYFHTQDYLPCTI